ncbi:phage tail tape measure C-terminal domain-containing protein [Hyphomonas sp.]|uniref:phage tail tape measure C-terminal domain-containing protein n=1 Tax=Hyphomonas sp. TaxID=87 RepID=UPI00391B5CB1
MNELELQLGAAGDALRDLGQGPAREAAEALSSAFVVAGQRIEASLARAAQSGELDFSRMAESILRDLARVAAEAIILRGQSGSPGVNATFNFPPGADGRGTAGQTAGLAAVLARMVQAGGRFL